MGVPVYYNEAVYLAIGLGIMVVVCGVIMWIDVKRRGR